MSDPRIHSGSQSPNVSVTDHRDTVSNVDDCGECPCGECCCSAERWYCIAWMICGFGWVFTLIYKIVGACLKHICGCCCPQCKQIGASFTDFSKWMSDPLFINVSRNNCGGSCGAWCNIIWLLPFGLVIALSHFALAVIYSPLHLVSCPFGMAHCQLGLIALQPMGLNVTATDSSITCCNNQFCSECRKLNDARGDQSNVNEMHMKTIAGGKSVDIELVVNKNEKTENEKTANEKTEAVEQQQL